VVKVPAGGGAPTTVASVLHLPTGVEADFGNDRVVNEGRHLGGGRQAYRERPWLAWLWLA
jgi:hypothetical protein